MSASLRLAELSRIAARLAGACAERNASAPPPMLILTDPRRTPDPLALARSLPRGSGLVYRSFGAADAHATAVALARIAGARGLVLLIGADMALAGACGAHGVHLPERALGQAHRLRAHWPGVLITGAAHGPAALARAADAGLDAALLSTVFPSRSPSAGPAMGAIRLARLVRSARLPVYALGGVDARTAPRLRGSGVAGVAAVGAALPDLRRG